jgi:iron(III) transport system substrate-binding protein
MIHRMSPTKSITLSRRTLLAGAAALAVAGCRMATPAADAIVVYCGVDEPYAREVFADFEKQTGLHVAPQYDVEASRSVGLAGKIEAERDHPRADVYWANEPFQNGRLATLGVLEPYISPVAAEIPAQFKDPNGFWTGNGLRARVLAVSSPPPDFSVTSITDLADPRLKKKVVISRPASGSSVAHVAALYSLWGEQKARDFFHRLRDNEVTLVGGNSEVAKQVGAGNFLLGLTDNDDIADMQANGGKLTMVIPDQGEYGEGTLAIPTTVSLVKGAKHPENAKKLIDFLIGRQAEQKLMELKFSRWRVRGGSESIKAMKIDYRKTVEIAPQAQREATAILDGREF